MESPPVKVACVVPNDVMHQYGAGNWKDFTSLNLALARLGHEVVTIGHSDGMCADVLDACGNGITDLIVHYSFWPEMIEQVRCHHPSIRVHTRMHNAEALQHLHRRAPGLLPTVENLRGWYGAVKLFQRDSRCRKLSDDLLCISEWDSRHYHRRLFGAAPLLQVPYFSPWPALRPQVRPQPWGQRRQAVVCLAGGRDRIGRSLRDSLAQIASHARTTSSGDAWRFEISSGTRPSPEDAAALGGLLPIGPVEEPWDLLCEVKTIAVITALGYGCKTTIVDALAAGCNVLVDKRLAPKLSPLLRSGCIEVAMNDSRSFDDALARAGQEPESNEVNEALEREATGSLRIALGQRKQ